LPNLIQGEKPKNLRAHNTKAILSLLWQEKGLTIREISNQVCLSVTTTHKIINHLLEQGIIISAGKGESTAEGGKCPEKYSLNASYCYLIVCSLSFPTSRLVLLDLTARTIDEVELYADPIMNHTYLETLDEISRKVDLILAKNHLSAGQIFRLVISTTGITNPSEGIIHDAFVSSWGKNVPITRDLSRKISLEIPIYLDNANVFIGYAENLNLSNSKRSYWVLLKDTGICIFNRMEPIRGSLGFIGLFTNAIIDSSKADINQRYPGGNFTSLVIEDTMLSYVKNLSPQYPRSSLAEKIQNSTLRAIDVFLGSDQGDDLARKAMDIVIYWFYIEWHNLIVSYNPQRVVIQGLYRKAGQYFIDQLKTLGKNLPSYEDKPSYEICYSNMEEIGAEASGAVFYVFQHFFIDSF
jgi:predicted NBD/HSP70 family sugar kinase